MTDSRRQDGRETWNRLLEWDKGQTPSERLAATLLASDGFSNVDPSHPLGGKDGLKDIVVTKDKLKLIVAVYFPRGQQTFSQIKTKFKSDFKGVAKNNVDGIVFFTNQELKLNERKELEKITGKSISELYHLERISVLLNTPQHYGIRSEFLQITMTADEIHALYAQRDTKYLEQLADVAKSLKDAANEIVGYVTGGDSFPIIEHIDDTFALRIEGKFPLRNVRLSIWDYDKMSIDLSVKIRDSNSFFPLKDQSLVARSTSEFFDHNQIHLLNIRIPDMQVNEVKRFSFETDSLNGWIRGDIFIRYYGIMDGARRFGSCTAVYRNGTRIYGKRTYGTDIEFDEQGVPIDW